MKIWWCQEHGHSAFLNLQPDRGCWAEAVNGKLCRMVPMRLIPDNAETVERITKVISDYDWWREPNANAILAALDGETP